MSSRRDRNKEAENEEVRARRKAKEAAPAHEEPQAEGVVSRAAEAQALSDPRFAPSANLPRKAQVLHGLQRSHGNAYVQRLISHGKREAHAEGNRTPISGRAAQRIANARKAGEPLQPETRHEMQAAFGRDFQAVRVHTDAEADRLNRDIQAQAFTADNDIFFHEGAYEPGTPLGKQLLAHELSHVAEDGVRRIAAEGGLRSVRRKPTVLPVPFLGSQPLNSSTVTYTPRGVLWVGGIETSSSNFPGGRQGTVQISAGTSGVVQVHMHLRMFADFTLINEYLTQSFYVSWEVSAARDGTLTISPTPMVTINAPTSTAGAFDAALESVSPAQGSNFVMVTPRIRGGGGGRGISLGVGMERAHREQTMATPFRLNIAVTNIEAPEGEVTIGPIRIRRNHEVVFERPRQDDVSSAQEGQLIRWYEGLSRETREQIESGASAVTLEGHASTTGDPAKNRELSSRRADAVQRILRQYGGNRVVFRTRAVGEYRAGTEDEVESQAERKVVVSVWEVAGGGEGAE